MEVQKLEWSLDIYDQYLGTKSRGSQGQKIKTKLAPLYLTKYKYNFLEIIHNSFPS